MRVVSLLPAATEAVWALGHGAELVGRTHECDYPEATAAVPVVTRPVAPEDPVLAGIDATPAAGDPHAAYEVDTDALRALEPDVVFARATCPVCANAAGAADDATCAMPRGARVVALDPLRLTEIIAAMETIGRALGDLRGGLALASHLERRLGWLERALSGTSPPRVAVLEWPDPWYAAGHWIPDMVEAAGGRPVLGTAGGPSRPIPVDDITAARPDVVVLAFRGFDLARVQQAHPTTTAGEGDALAAEVVAVDAAGHFSRPGPRVVEGVEALAWVLHEAHPDLRPAPGTASRPVGGAWQDVATT